MDFSMNRSFVLILLLQYIAHYRVSKIIRKHTKHVAPKSTMNTLKLVIINAVTHRMDKRKSFVFARRYRNCFSWRISTLVPRN